MTIDKQKLLQWIEDEKYVFEVPPLTEENQEEIDMCKGAIKVLNRLKHRVEFDVFEEGEHDGRETNDQQSNQHIQEIQHEPEGSFLTTALHNVDPALG